MNTPSAPVGRLSIKPFALWLSVIPVGVIVGVMAFMPLNRPAVATTNAAVPEASVMQERDAAVPIGNTWSSSASLYEIQQEDPHDAMKEKLMIEHGLIRPIVHSQGWIYHFDALNKQWIALHFTMSATGPVIDEYIQMQNFQFER